MEQPQQNEIEFLKAALWYRKKGLSVIPCKPKSKVALIPWTKYQKQLPTEEQVRMWWTQNPDANIAIVLGRVSNIITLEVDDEKAISGHIIPVTPQAKSGGKGLPHIYFRYVEGMRNYKAQEIGSELFSIRGDRQYVNVPPSIHQSGNPYKWCHGLGLDEVELADPPDWVLELINDDSAKEEAKSNLGTKGKTYEGEFPRAKIIEIIRKYWTEEQRQELAMCLAGFLAKQRIPWSDAANLILEVAALCNDSEIGQRIAAIKATFTKVQKGQSIKGYRGLEEILGPEDLQVLTTLFDSFRVQVAEADRDYSLPDQDILPISNFPFDIFPEELRSIIERISQALQVEPEVVASIILGLIGGAIGNTIRISPKFGYQVSPFPWIIIIASSGYGKTPAIDALIKPINVLQAEAYKTFQQEVAEYKQKVRMSKQDAQIELPEEPKLEHYFLSDTTVEAMANAFESTPRGVIIYQDELAALILGLDQYKARGKGNDRQHYLELFDCHSWKIDRKSGTKFIPNTGAAIIGDIQPKFMPRVFFADSFEDGLLPRLLFLNVENKPLKFSRQGIDKDDVVHWEDLLNWCYEIPVILDENGFAKPKLLIPNSEGLNLWEAFYNEYGEMVPFLSDRAKVFIPKLLTYSLKFMAILHIINTFSNRKSDEGVKVVKEVKVVIDEDTVANAIKLTRFFTGQAISVLNLYRPAEPKLNEFEQRLVKTLYMLKEEVTNGKLHLSRIVEVFNSQLPDKLKHTPEKVSSLLRRGLRLNTTQGTGNHTVLLWEGKKIEELFSKITLTSLTSLTANPIEVKVVKDVKVVMENEEFNMPEVLR